MSEPNQKREVATTSISQVEVEFVEYCRFARKEYKAGETCLVTPDQRTYLKAQQLIK